MAWRTGGVKPSDVPFGFSSTPPQPRRVRRLLALIALAVVLAVGSLMPRAGGARVIAGLGVLAVVALFAVQVHYLTDRFPGTRMWDTLDTGWYVAAIAGFLGLVSGFMPSGWTRRRRTESEFADKRASYEDQREYH